MIAKVAFSKGVRTVLYIANVMIVEQPIDKDDKLLSTILWKMSDTKSWDKKYRNRDAGQHCGTQLLHGRLIL